MKKIAVSLIIALVFGFSGCGDNNDTQNALSSENEVLKQEIENLKNASSETTEPITEDETITETTTIPPITEPPSTTEEPKSEKIEVSFGDTFVFDDFEITFDSNITFDTVNNQFSDYNGKDVIKFPVTIKNIGGNTHGLNIFYYKFYNPAGTESKSISNYFEDDVAKAGDMRSSATQYTYMHVLYEGDGDYYVEFVKKNINKIEVKLPVSYDYQIETFENIQFKTNKVWQKIIDDKTTFYYFTPDDDTQGIIYVSSVYTDFEVDWDKDYKNAFGGVINEIASSNKLIDSDIQKINGRWSLFCHYSYIDDDDGLKYMVNTTYIAINSTKTIYISAITKESLYESQKDVIDYVLNSVEVTQ